MRTTRAIISTFALMITLAAAADEAKKTGESKPAKPEPAATEQQGNANESPLVKAARESKARRDSREGEKSRISITNEDVKKSEGKLIQSNTKPLAPLPAASDVETTMRDTNTARTPKVDRVSLQAEVDKHQQTVSDLEKELRRIEETYYNEDDPDYREDVLAESFQQTKDQLEAARKELAAARKALAGAGSN